MCVCVCVLVCARVCAHVWVLQIMDVCLCMRVCVSVSGCLCGCVGVPDDDVMLKLRECDAVQTNCPLPCCSPQQTCAVCLEDFKVKDDLGVLPCQHAFHRK